MALLSVGGARIGVMKQREQAAADPAARTGGPTGIAAAVLTLANVGADPGPVTETAGPSGSFMGSRFSHRTWATSSPAAVRVLSTSQEVRGGLRDVRPC